MPFSTASSMLRHRISSALRTRGGASSGPSRWSSPGHEERPKGYLFNRTPLPPGQSRKWEDWELPCYITSFLTIVILGVGLNAKPDLTIETWAHQKALERLETEKLSLSGSADSDWKHELKLLGLFERLIKSVIGKWVVYNEIVALVCKVRGLGCQDSVMQKDATCLKFPGPRIRLLTPMEANQSKASSVNAIKWADSGMSLV
ncbi:hypothetical protein SADUNF_Sadunf06G0040900 [Salix dunnii]|uniref:Uncharacterized protein n=1 Tax=Salix dunnii TaxID=1413687 RepID=A0A835K312_9ROSI|nr:hypothetical protein SADUNF_Sadunf06G0040900 [Salix dunnii]